MLPKKETLEIEFKSDRNLMSDNDIVDVVVGLANTNCGFLYIGIEDDGEVRRSTYAKPILTESVTLNLY